MGGLMGAQIDNPPLNTVTLQPSTVQTEPTPSPVPSSSSEADPPEDSSSSEADPPEDASSLDQEVSDAADVTYNRTALFDNNPCGGLALNAQCVLDWEDLRIVSNC